jgi:hypothetical protein
MLYGEIIAVYSQIHTKHINTLCGQDVEIAKCQAGSSYSAHWNSENKRGQTSRIPWFSLVSPDKCRDMTFHNASAALHQSVPSCPFILLLHAESQVH